MESERWSQRRTAGWWTIFDFYITSRYSHIFPSYGNAAIIQQLTLTWPQNVFPMEVLLYSKISFWFLFWSFSIKQSDHICLLRITYLRLDLTQQSEEGFPLAFTIVFVFRCLATTEFMTKTSRPTHWALIQSYSPFGRLHIICYIHNKRTVIVLL